MSAVSSPPGLSQIVMGLSQPPTVAPTAAAGSTASASIEGSNVSGKITLAVSGLGIATGKVMSMTYADAPPYKNSSAIAFTAGNANFAAVNGQLYAVSSKTGVDLYVTGLVLAAGTYIGYYQVIGY